MVDEEQLDLEIAYLTRIILSAAAAAAAVALLIWRVLAGIEQLGG